MILLSLKVLSSVFVSELHKQLALLSVEQNTLGKHISLGKISKKKHSAKYNKYFTNKNTRLKTKNTQNNTKRPLCPVDFLASTNKISNKKYFSGNGLCRPLSWAADHYVPW
jgi:hypothetical protein